MVLRRAFRDGDSAISDWDMQVLLDEGKYFLDEYIGELSEYLTILAGLVEAKLMYWGVLK